MLCKKTAKTEISAATKKFLGGGYKIFSIIDCSKSFILKALKNEKQAFSIIELSVVVFVSIILLSSIIVSKRIIINAKASSVYADVNKFQTLVSIFYFLVLISWIM